MVEPEPQSALDFVRDSLARRKTLLLVGACRVNYAGRAESELGLGERMLIVKEDGAILVHRPTGYEPVNWQPNGCVFQTELRDNRLTIRAVRPKPHETLTLTFHKVDMVAQLDLIDRSDLVLYASEAEMQRAVLLDPEIVEPGFHPITREKRMKPGFVDVYGRDSQGNPVVIEIKRKTAGKEAVLQLWKYIQSLKGNEGARVRGILMAPKLAKGAQRLLETLNLEYKPISPKKCTEILHEKGGKKLSGYFKTI